MAYCKIEDCFNPVENKDTGLCATHSKQLRKEGQKLLEPKKEFKPIAKVSKKMKENLSDYSDEKKEWIVGKRCAVFPVLPAQDIHHMKGRTGYADEWAREHGITLLMDKRFWLAVSRKGHIEIGENPKLALEKGWSLPRH